jgi:hypothetical protein
LEGVALGMPKGGDGTVAAAVPAVSAVGAGVVGAGALGEGVRGGAGRLGAAGEGEAGVLALPLGLAVEDVLAEARRAREDEGGGEGVVANSALLHCPALHARPAAQAAGTLS